MDTNLQLETRDGLILKGRYSSETVPKGLVCLFHGLGEHSLRYLHVMKMLNKKGYATVAVDMRGHGESEGKLGHADNHDQLMDDLSLVLEKAKELYPDLPVFLFGHSLGGNLVLTYLYQKQPEISGTIATAPLLKLAHEPPAKQQKVLRILNALKIQTPLPSGLDNTLISRDVDTVYAYQNDPLVHDKLSPAMAVNMLDAGEWLLDHAANPPGPILLMHGDADKVTSCDASKEFAEKAGTNCTLRIWNGLFHEPHNEPEKKHVIAFMIQWLNRQINQQ